MDILSAILLYVLIGMATLVPIVLFAFALASRRSYRCPRCGEQITTEYLDAQHCGMCGAPLRRKEYTA